jgi:hypothetical protein
MVDCLALAPKQRPSAQTVVERVMLLLQSHYPQQLPLQPAPPQQQQQ